MRPRDNQRARVYAWERATQGPSQYVGTMSLEEAEVFIKRVWRAERGRYGRARVPTPALRDGRGQRSALAFSNHAIGLPRWARNPYVALHEIAHLLTPRDEAHGPRFTGVLIGLAARWMGGDPEFMLHKAESMGVRVNRGSIGAVPRYGLPARVLRHLPGKDITIAVRLNLLDGCSVTYRQVRGAALHLVRRGQARWRGKTLIAVTPPNPA